MPRSHRDSWQSASPVLDTALDLPPAARAAWLASIRASSPELADRLPAGWPSAMRSSTTTSSKAPPPSSRPGRPSTGCTRRLPAGRAARPWRDGQRVAGGTHRRPLRRPGRRQAADAALVGRPARRASARGPDSRPADASADRPLARCRRVADRSAVPGAGARRRRTDRSHCDASGWAWPHGCACSSTSWRRSRTRTPTWSCTATEALQRDGDGRRRGQAPRLRHRPVDRER